MGAKAIIGVTLGLALGLAGCGRGEKTDREPGADVPIVTKARVEGEPVPSPTLDAVKARGRLNCGVHEGLVGFAYIDNRGAWRGFDADFCRGMAAAIFGNPDAVRFVPLTARNRFEALAAGQVDVVWRNSSWTMERDTAGDLSFAGINYYDGQGFMVRRSLTLNSATELNGARVCVQAGSTSALNVGDFFRARGIAYQPVTTADEAAARQAYADEDCDAFTADISALAAARTTLANPEQHAILPDVISKEALGPVVRRGDEQWTSVVRWTLNALILAEELGVTQANVEQQTEDATDPRIRRLLGVEGELGERLGLSKTWAGDAVAGVGNYGEIFERNLGTQSALDLARGLNAQWNSRPGGLIYALPLR